MKPTKRTGKKTADIKNQPARTSQTFIESDWKMEGEVLALSLALDHFQNFIVEFQLYECGLQAATEKLLLKAVPAVNLHTRRPVA